MDMAQTIITKMAEETAAVGQKIGIQYLEAVKQRNNAIKPVICLFGDLGSGKTTFTQGFANGLGIKTRLLSPTFIIVRRYPLKNLDCFFYHLDLYRMTSENELKAVSLQPSEINGDFHISIDGKKIFDRKEYGGFPEIKELKQLVRDIAAPGKSLGHTDTKTHHN